MYSQAVVLMCCCTKLPLLGFASGWQRAPRSAHGWRPASSTLRGSATWLLELTTHTQRVWPLPQVAFPYWRANAPPRRSAALVRFSHVSKTQRGTTYGPQRCPWDVFSYSRNQTFPIYDIFGSSSVGTPDVQFPKGKCDVLRVGKSEANVWDRKIRSSHRETIGIC